MTDEEIRDRIVVERVNAVEDPFEDYTEVARYTATDPVTGASAQADTLEVAIDNAARSAVGIQLNGDMTVAEAIESWFGHNALCDLQRAVEHFADELHYDDRTGGEKSEKFDELVRKLAYLEECLDRQQHQ